MSNDLFLESNKKKILEIMFYESGLHKPTLYKTELSFSKIKTYANLSREDTHDALHALIKDGMVSASRKFNFESTADEDSIFSLTHSGKKQANIIVNQKLAENRYQDQKELAEHEKQHAKKKFRGWFIGITAALVVLVILLIVFLWE